jgi:hypothetical protein
MVLMLIDRSWPFSVTLGGREAKRNPTQDAGFFHWQTLTYCRGSTLSNTRFASNELSSINC